MLLHFVIVTLELTGVDDITIGITCAAFCFHIAHIIIIVIIIIPVIPSTHGIYSYVPQTNSVSTVYSVAAVLYVQSLLHVMLFGMLNMFCTFTSALPTVCVQCPVWLVSVVP